MYQMYDLSKVYPNARTLNGCPWCSAAPSLFLDYDEMRAQCRCQNCGARGIEVTHKTLNKRQEQTTMEEIQRYAIMLWNMRKC